MKKSLLVLPMFLLLGCDVSFDQKLKYANDATSDMATMAIPATNALCGRIVQKCQEEEDADCVDYHKCDTIRSKLLEIFIQIKFAILDAEAAKAIGDSKSAGEALLRAVKLLSELRNQLSLLGVQ